MTCRAALNHRGQSVPSLGHRASLAAFLALLFAVHAAIPASAGEGTWTRVGQEGESLTAVAVSPSDPDTILASSDLDSLVRTADRGRIWTPSQPGLKGLRVTSIQFDPRDSKIAYVGTSGGGPGPDAPPGSGLYRSADGGVTWQMVSGAWIAGIAISPQDPRIVYASALLPGEKPAILRSADHGLTWSTLPGPLEGSGAVAVDPRDPSALLAVFSAGDFGYGTAYLSTDGGKSWSQPALRWARELAFSRSGSMVLASRADASADPLGYEVHRSADGGRSWRRVFPTRGRLEGYMIRALLTDPLDDTTVLVGADGAQRAVWRSTNGGNSFTQVGSGFGSGELRALALDRANPQTLYAATDDGLWAYTLPQRASGLPATGEPPAETYLPVLAGLGAAVALIGLRIRTRSRWSG